MLQQITLQLLFSGNWVYFRNKWLLRRFITLFQGKYGRSSSPQEGLQDYVNKQVPGDSFNHLGLDVLISKMISYQAQQIPFFGVTSERFWEPGSRAGSREAEMSESCSYEQVLDAVASAPSKFSWI